MVDTDGLYAARKRRMDRDPEFKARVLGHQAESRRRRRGREWQEHVARAGQAGLAVCHHVYPNDRRCWKLYAHKHGGIDTDQ